MEMISPISGEERLRLTRSRISRAWGGARNCVNVLNSIIYKRYILKCRCWPGTKGMKREAMRDGGWGARSAQQAENKITECVPPLNKRKRGM